MRGQRTHLELVAIEVDHLSLMQKHFRIRLRFAGCRALHSSPCQRCTRLIASSISSDELHNSTLLASALLRARQFSFFSCRDASSISTLQKLLMGTTSQNPPSTRQTHLACESRTFARLACFLTGVSSASADRFKPPAFLPQMRCAQNTLTHGAPHAMPFPSPAEDRGPGCSVGCGPSTPASSARQTPCMAVMYCASSSSLLQR